MKEFTSSFSYTFETATKISNYWSKGLTTGNDVADWGPEYNTAIKDIDLGIDKINCWAITNKFDPRCKK